ncbi:MAG: NADH-ubiquinone oxidoreductase-F iron-sulfur binding region domain-containing protein [Candidatus Pacebacteria bacterium]|nr:NADH-ubiquinone oxidoreductase-F iron-sulfur binding region domain-containing protein [Candidatus Paceibacterota bacterium]
MKENIIQKIRNSKLRGRGGGNFETWIKWDLVKKSLKKDKYVICNGAEGELDVSKDGYILDNYLEDVLNGILIAMDEVGAKKAYFYLRSDYYLKYKSVLDSLIKDKQIIVFEKPDIGYIGGEETTICEIIEGKSGMPRIKPPYLTEKGLFDCPTLINNVETFYCVSKISKNEYSNERFYSLSGDIKNKGVFVFHEDMTIEEILKRTDNYPSFDFFVQSGGGALGEFLLPEDISVPVFGIGSIIVFNKQATDIYSLIEKIMEFFHKGNCDKCVPCREGSFMLYKMAKNKKINHKKMEEILYSLENSSFCALGKSIAIPLRSIFKKILKDEKNKI